MNMRFMLMAAAGLLTLAAVPAFADTHEGKGDRGAKMFDKWDADKNGTITEAEYVTHAKERFAKMDGNGDGSVTKEEAKAAHEAMRAKWKEHKESSGEDSVND